MKPSVTDPTNDAPLVSSDDIEHMVHSFFDFMLELPIDRCESGPGNASGCLRATIDITGDWQAEVQVSADPTLAGDIAQAMFAMPPEDLSEDEIQDALAEAVNVIGGNIKGHINRECDLSLPDVRTSDWSAESAGNSVYFRCKDGNFAVTVCD